MDGDMAGSNGEGSGGDAFLGSYDPSEIRVAAEFLNSWLSFLSADLCPGCSQTLSNRIRSLGAGTVADTKTTEPNDTASLATTADIKAANPSCGHSSSSNSNAEPNLVSSSRGAPLRSYRMALEASNESKPKARKGQAAEAVLKEEESQGKRQLLSREQREYLRFTDVKRNKELVLFESVKGRRVNILEGLELHTGIFSAAEQRKIVDFVYELRDIGRKGELKERTYTAPAKWMRGKGRETIQFGCCYNYAVDKRGNPPGILYNESVDPLPTMFKTMIKRLVQWHVLPPTCVPDSCIVNIYDEGDCIPPHIDNHDFVRPFCTVSFLSECKILFGSTLKVVSPGEFAGPFALPLPVGSVLVMNGNGADVAKHCVPAVPTKRISVTFRKMDESKRPRNYRPEPDLLGIQPLSYESSGKSSVLESVVGKDFCSTSSGLAAPQARGRQPRICRISPPASE